ncbi:MAG TPA: biopolymer transporter ExbD [Fusobacterium sp.]|uniref:ExbD/TolR family protein n=1 Tax=Fusobacterium sp. TaxID=68766 RepID=UPI002F42BAA0
MKIERNKRRGAGELALEMTPMIDVVFLLLIFFMLATTFDKKSGIKIDLPKSVIREEKLVHKLQLFADKNENLYLSYEQAGKEIKIPVTKENLQNRLQEQFHNTEDKKLVISADKTLSHGYIVDLMSAAKGAGAEGLNIDTNYQK